MEIIKGVIYGLVISLLLIVGPCVFAEIIEMGPDEDPPIEGPVQYFLLDPLTPKHPCPEIDILQPITLYANCKYTYDTETGIFTIPLKCLFYVQSMQFDEGRLFSSTICNIKVIPVDDLNPENTT